MEWRQQLEGANKNTQHNTKEIRKKKESKESKGKEIVDEKKEVLKGKLATKNKISMKYDKENKIENSIIIIPRRTTRRMTKEVKSQVVETLEQPSIGIIET